MLKQCKDVIRHSNVGTMSNNLQQPYKSQVNWEVFAFLEQYLNLFGKKLTRMTITINFINKLLNASEICSFLGVPSLSNRRPKKQQCTYGLSEVKRERQGEGWGGSRGRKEGCGCINRIKGKLIHREKIQTTLPYIEKHMNKLRRNFQQKKKGWNKTTPQADYAQNPSNSISHS